MSDRPSATNGKRNQAWGSLDSCPACGQCLCFGCHPQGPCLDEKDATRFGPAFAAHVVGRTLVRASFATAQRRSAQGR
jgi:hypothetical protein